MAIKRLRIHYAIRYTILMNTVLSKLSLEEKIGQLLMASLDGPALDTDALRFLAENHIGNIIHFGNNIQSREQITALNASLEQEITTRCGVSPLIGVDHEGGRVMRFGGDVTWFPSVMAIAATGDTKNSRAIGRAMGEELRALGFRVNFAPVLDVNTNAENPVIGIRSYGDDPNNAGLYGAAFLQGLQGAGVMACGKHFPGHGDTLVDSHYGLPRIEKTLEALEAVELVPFTRAIRDGLSSIMTSHILFPRLEPREVPATLSDTVLLGLLRERLGFNGLIVSDGMQMRAILEHYGVERGCVEAVKNGVDLLCVGTAGAGTAGRQASCYHALLTAARSGELPSSRIDDAVSRVLRIKEAYCSEPNPHEVDWAAHAALAQSLADASVTRLRGELKPLQGRILCVSDPAFATVSGVAEGDLRHHSFAELAAVELGCAQAALTSVTRSALDACDTLVLGAAKAPEELNGLARDALSLGKRVCVVLTGLPYTVEDFPHACDILCVYGLTAVSIKAACRVLLGIIPAEGTLPVRI